MFHNHITKGLPKVINTSIQPNSRDACVFLDVVLFTVLSFTMSGSLNGRTKRDDQKPIDPLADPTFKRNLSRMRRFQPAVFSCTSAQS